VAAVWVDPAAADEERIFANNRDATIGAIRAAVTGEPRAEAIVAAADDPANPFFRTGRA
jgi:5,6,7,8-tetrahydromethanopterin hydro-lyase